MAWWLEFDGDGFDGDVPDRSLPLRDRRLKSIYFDAWSGHTEYNLRERILGWWIDLHYYRRRQANLDLHVRASPHEQVSLAARAIWRGDPWR
jgi:hypothetical protein